jgi:hypothetical protein
MSQASSLTQLGQLKLIGPSGTGSETVESKVQRGSQTHEDGNYDTDFRVSKHHF